MRLLVYVVPVALAIYALFDLYRSEEHERSGLPPVLWALVIIVLPVLGPIVWIFTSTVRRAEASSQGGGGQNRPRGVPGGPAHPPRPPRPSGPVAPDDDPEFLRELERQWRRTERGDDAPDEPSPGGAPKS